MDMEPVSKTMCPKKAMLMKFHKLKRHATKYKSKHLQPILRYSSSIYLK
jgi:hypothetical protein